MMTSARKSERQKHDAEANGNFVVGVLYFRFVSDRANLVDRPMIITMKWDGIGSHQNLLQLIPDFKLILQKIRDHLWTETETDASETHVLESRFEI